MKSYSKKVALATIGVFAIVAVFTGSNHIDTFFNPSSRGLQTSEHAAAEENHLDADSHISGSRHLQWIYDETGNLVRSPSYTPPLPDEPTLAPANVVERSIVGHPKLACANPTKISWESYQPNEQGQLFTLPDGNRMVVRVTAPPTGTVTDWRAAGGGIEITAGGLIEPDSFITNMGYNKGYSNDDPPFPSSAYGTLELEFQLEVSELFVDICKFNSDLHFADIARARLYDTQGNHVPFDMFKMESEIRAKHDFAYVQYDERHYHDALVYVKPRSKVKLISIDVSALTFVKGLVGTGQIRGIISATDFQYCGMDEPTTPPVPPPSRSRSHSGGSNGDPLIMGLSGQIFKFDGRSGAWYSGISSKSFQYNFKVQKFEGCPSHSNSFITGIGLTLFKDRSLGKQSKEHKIEINVVNEHSTNVGCGNQWHKGSDLSCLGSGSLEMTIDGHKIVKSTEHRFQDGAGSVTAFNTIAACSRKWYDFDFTPSNDLGLNFTSTSDSEQFAIARRRRLGETRSDRDSAEDTIFTALEQARDTMLNPAVCSAWMSQRKQKGDIFQHPGSWSTIFIQTGKVSIHVEYKQERERCHAHNLDVWISRMSPDVMAEPWEGVIGETKSSSFDPTKQSGDELKPVSRLNALKFPEDEAYEVVSPYSIKCKGCLSRPSFYA